MSIFGRQSPEPLVRRGGSGEGGCPHNVPELFRVDFQRLRPAGRLTMTSTRSDFRPISITIAYYFVIAITIAEIVTSIVVSHPTLERYEPLNALMWFYAAPMLFLFFYALLGTLSRIEMSGRAIAIAFMLHVAALAAIFLLSPSFFQTSGGLLGRLRAESLLSGLRLLALVFGVLDTLVAVALIVLFRSRRQRAEFPRRLALYGVVSVVTVLLLSIAQVPLVMIRAETIAQGRAPKCLKVFDAKYGGYVPARPWRLTHFGMQVNSEVGSASPYPRAYAAILIAGSGPGREIWVWSGIVKGFVPYSSELLPSIDSQYASCLADEDLI